MPIPPLQPDGYLAPGDHEATLDEIEAVFGSAGFRRRELSNELRNVAEALWGFGVTRIWVDGSFVSAKQRPRDIEVVYEAPSGVDPSQWGLYAPSRREDLKRMCRIDLFEEPGAARHAGLLSRVQGIREFFSTDRNGVPKGMLVVRRPK